MATTQYVKYPSNTGGVTSINGEIGPAISIVSGTGISIGTLGNTITVTNTGSGSTTENVEYRTLSAGEATAKALTLSATPITAAKTVVDAIGGCGQVYSADFIVVVNILSWSGLGLDGILAAGDILRIAYLS